MKKLGLLFVLVAALFTLASCGEDGVLSAKKNLTMPAAVANIPVGSTLAIKVEPHFGVLDVPADIDEPFTNDWEKEPEFEEWFSINGGATVGRLDSFAFPRGGATGEFIQEQAEAVFEYYLTGEKAYYFQPSKDEDQKALFSTAPADFNYETYPYEPILIAGGEPLVPTFVMADDPAAADYTLDVYYSITGDVDQVTEFTNEGPFTDYWDAKKKYIKQAGDVYLYYQVLTNYKLINNATGEVVCEAMTEQGDPSLKKYTTYVISGTQFIGNSADAAALLNKYDFKDKAVDLIIESIQNVIPCLRVMWYCNADDMTIVYPEAEAE